MLFYYGDNKSPHILINYVWHAHETINRENTNSSFETAATVFEPCHLKYECSILATAPPAGCCKTDAWFPANSAPSINTWKPQNTVSVSSTGPLQWWMTATTARPVNLLNTRVSSTVCHHRPSGAAPSCCDTPPVADDNDTPSLNETNVTEWKPTFFFLRHRYLWCCSTH